MFTQIKNLLLSGCISSKTMLKNILLGIVFSVLFVFCVLIGISGGIFWLIGIGFGLIFAVCSIVLFGIKSKLQEFKRNFLK